MTSPYFNFTEEAVPNSVVDATQYNFTMQRVEEAFDLIPPPVQLLTGSLSYSVNGGSPNLPSAEIIYGFQPGQYREGDLVAVNIDVANTGLSMLTVNSRGCVIISVDGGLPTVQGSFFENGIYTFVYDGFNFQCLEITAGRYSIALVDAQGAAQSLSRANAAKNASAASAVQAANLPTSPTFTGDVTEIILNVELVTGCVEVFDTGVDPNEVFPGTTWTNVPLSVITVPVSAGSAWRRDA